MSSFDPNHAAAGPGTRQQSQHRRDRLHARRRFRRRGRRAYIRSVYFLPSLATLGNAVCGFAAMYVAALDPIGLLSGDRITRFFALHSLDMAAYLIFMAMLFDAIDGRLARFTRHTTDFGGQLDSLADVISFGVAPAFISLQLIRSSPLELSVGLSRLIWAIGALYVSCAALRLARFNVSNKHGEQHHFSFLGLPSPAAGGAIAAFILMQRDMQRQSTGWALLDGLANVCLLALPVLLGALALLMVSKVRYPHLVNRYLRGRRSLAQLVGVLALGLLVIVAHRYVLGLGTLAYALWGPLGWAMRRLRPRGQEPPPP
jgi:CDP-diacylglycerol--serine O-phosphatidyltransferase